MFFRVDLQENEKIIKIYRQTKLVLAKYFTISFFAIVLPWRFLATYGLVSKLQIYLAVWSGLWLAYVIHRYLLWRLNCYVLTDKRLINLIFHSTIHKKVIEAPLERILNISYETNGMLAALFNYGDICVQIVGPVEPLVFTKISRPAKAKDFLWNIHNKYSPSGQTIEPAKIQETIGYRAKPKPPQT